MTDLLKTQPGTVSQAATLGAPPGVTVRAGAEGVGGTSVVEIVTTILNVRTGQVIWFGVVSGAPGSVADFGSVASAVVAPAETLWWYVQ